ncbi:unnamed protein product [Urochloa decumbens]|uniref:Protein FAR1-RELATED SEQUENCE n=1 Tax=Urochloa decumbens TaxID=240449 RepID=A0ABC9EL29_9POAL
MDLNQVPEEFGYDFLDAVTANPLFCTQPMTGLEGSNQIGSSSRQFEVANQTSGDAFNGTRSTSPIGYVDAESSQRNINGLGFSQPVILDVQDGHGNHQNANVDADSTQGCAVCPGFTQPAALDAQEGDGDDITDDVWCTPPIPYTGQTFGSKAEARHDTREQLKVTYVCNKQGRVKQEAQQKAQDIPEPDDDIQEGSEPDEGDDGAHKKKKKLDRRKKRKREKMQRTDCKARFVVKLIGDSQKVPYEGKDVGNFRSGIRRTEKYMDMQETLDYFMELEEEDPDFFHKVKLDKENRVESIFWVDGAAKHAYIESYHDCVSFDATYMTNMYDMPFTPFIGINSHGQSFQLGCAFLRDEKTPSYKWLFETFLEAMKGKAPLNIITDQDGAMRNAIALVFHNTCHRNCRWHIMDKFSGTIGPILDEDAELEEDFKECINHTVTPGEFEEKWAAMINKHWQYQKLQEKCLVAEEGQDFRTEDRERRRWSKYPIERHASTVYTKNLFYRFFNEFEKIAEYDVEPKGEFQYLLVPNNTKVYGNGKRSYLVTAIADESSFYCECSKYDRDGILCCHVMKVLTRLGVKTIPEQYIMKRWSLKAVESNDNSTANTHMKADFIARGMPLNNKKTLWFTNLSTSFAELAADGCLSSERYNIMQDHIKQMRSAINEIKKRKRASRQKEINRPPAASGAQAQAGPSCVDGAAAESVGCLFATTPTAGDGGIPVSVPAAISTPVGNPPRSKVKGRKKEKRLKKGMNAEPKRKNKCRICKKEGHTAPRCPDREGEGVSSVQ